MRIDLVTIFPKMFAGPFKESILKRAVNKGLLEIKIHNLRDFTQDRHRTVDDYSFGGGGMVLKPEPIFRAINAIKSRQAKIILMTPAGRQFNSAMAKKLSRKKHLIFICGHYEGVDERVSAYVDEEISIGDYVLTGGELPAMVVVDALARMIKGVLGKEDAAKDDSFYHGLLDYSHYTRPREFQGMKVPQVLLSGNHGNIRQWRKSMAIKRTKKRRPDLLKM